MIFGLFLLTGLLVLSTTPIFTPVCSFDPNIEDDPEDPGNSPGPGYTEKPIPFDEKFEIICYDGIPNIGNFDKLF